MSAKRVVIRNMIAITMIQILVLLLLLPVPNLATANPIDLKKYPAFFNFGDSNSDTGNKVTSYLNGNVPKSCGRTYFHKRSGRYCDGRLIIDFLMNATDLPFLNPYLDSVAAPSFRRECNFASAGSTILTEPPTGSNEFSFPIQVSQFLKFKDKVLDIENQTCEFDKYIPAREYFVKGLYMLDIGQNDLAGIFYYKKTIEQITAWIPTVLKSFEDGIKDLYYQAGVRNFWIHNTVPLGCLFENIARFGTDPSKLDEFGCVMTHNQAAKIFNVQLRALCERLEARYQGANVTYVDIFSIKSDLIAHFSRYGFEEPLMPCYSFNKSSGTATVCEDSSKYVNWDGVHYTDAANRHVASAILTGKYSSRI